MKLRLAQPASRADLLNIAQLGLGITKRFVPWYQQYLKRLVFRRKLLSGIFLNYKKKYNLLNMDTRIY